MNVLIVGASGFIGVNLVNYLQANYKVQTLSLRNQKWCEEIKNPDVYVNLVGKAHDHKGIASKKDFYDINLDLTKELFDNFQHSNAKLFIHMSSIAAVEETASTLIVDETTQEHPISFYGKSKKAADDYLLAQRLSGGKRLIILRPTMVHGPGDKGNLKLLYEFVNRGLPYPLGAFENGRSFLSIDNLTFLIGEILKKEIPSGVYVVADDSPLSTKEIIYTIGLVCERNVRILALPKRIILALGKLGDFLGLPLNTKKLSKLTSSLLVSNAKIKTQLNLQVLPHTAVDGMKKTIVSFMTLGLK